MRLSWTRLGIAFAVVTAAVTAHAPSARAATINNNCYVATGNAAHVLCWLDLTGYGGTGTTTISWKLPDGSTLSGSLENASTTSVGPLSALPAYGKSELGTNVYTGVGGKPAVYGGSAYNSTPLTLANLTLTSVGGTTATAISMVGADAETVDSGDGTTGGLFWSSTGNTAWNVLQHPTIYNQGCTIVIGGAAGAETAKCPAPTTGPYSDIYILNDVIATNQSVSMDYITGAAADNGYAFAVELASIDLSKTLAGRIATTDQFTVTTSSGTATSYTASTTGTGTTATTGNGVVVPGTPYTLAETDSNTTDVGQYESTIACTNATTGSATTLPAGSGRSFTLTPAIDDQIACTFTNVPLTMTNTPVTATATYGAGTSQTDSFTLKNTSTVAGTFVVAAPTLTANGGVTAPAPTGYTFGGTTYTTIATLNAAIAAAGATAAGGTITVGVTYTTSGAASTTDTVTLPATLTAGDGTSASESATETDTLTPAATLTISKTGTSATSPGGLIAYTIAIGNNGPSNANGSTLSDPLPTGVTIQGTATCTASNGAACATPTTTTTTGTTPTTTVADTITTLPVGGTVTITFDATAAAAGSYTNTATVTPPTGETGGAQSASLTTTVAQGNGLVKTVVDLSTTGATPTMTNDTAKPGDILQYALKFTNSTGAPITGLAISDPVPANTTFVSDACPGAGTTLPPGVTGCTATPAAPTTGTTIKFTFAGTLAAGGSVTATFNVKVI